MRNSPLETTLERDGARERPLLDLKTGDLWFAGQCIRPWKRSAKNQDLILKSFAEQNWAPRIDDPLPGGCADPRDRLHQTLKVLNASLSPPLVEFHRDGTGKGIKWSPCPAPGSEQVAVASKQKRRGARRNLNKG